MTYPDHTHECRDCGSSIPCDGDGETCWAGGNSGCTECARENYMSARENFYAYGTGV